MEFNYCNIDECLTPPFRIDQCNSVYVQTEDGKWLHVCKTTALNDDEKKFVYSQLSDCSVRRR